MSAKPISAAHGLLIAAALAFCAPVHAVQFVTPLGGQPFKDWTIVNYVDTTPGPGVSDYRGGIYSYNGHDAIDFTLPNFAAMYRDVPVFAAASGTVVSIHDGEFDECSWANPCGNNPNYITIDHGGGITTQYLHLAKGSVNVAVGQAVTAGQSIGLVGSSGLSTDPHLHFAVFENGQVVDTYQDPGKWWVDPLPYAGDQRGVLDAGISDHLPTNTEWTYRPPQAGAFDPDTGARAFMWVNFFGTNSGDTIDFIWRRPDGTQVGRSSWNVAEYSFARWVASFMLPDDPASGLWSVDFRINGNVLTTRTFAVGAVPEPQTYALLLSGLLVLAFTLLSRRRAGPWPCHPLYARAKLPAEL